MEAIRELRMLRFAWTKIANILNISRQTLHCHLNGSGLMGFTDVTDEELDGIIQSYKATHPNDGEQIITGFLRSIGMCIQSRRITESIHRVDPAGVEERVRTTIRRRRYHVDAPNEVWHMDGYHTFIWWKFVIHGAIDGFSRLIVFLKC